MILCKIISFLNFKFTKMRKCCQLNYFIVAYLLMYNEMVSCSVKRYKKVLLL